MMQTVFIGGHPRSGTTLLGAMVGTHSGCICTPESHFKTQGIRYFDVSSKDGVSIPAAFDLIKNHLRYRIWGLGKKLNPPDSISSYKELLIWIVKAYAAVNNRPSPFMWVDHTTTNIKHAEKLLQIFPEAKFIHIIRDGRAVAASIMPLDWGPNTIDRAAASWVDITTSYIQIESKIGSEKIMRVRYEDLVSNAEKVLRGICGFLNLDYQSAMINGKGFKVPAYQDKQHSLIGEKPDINRINAWERKLTQRQAEIFESIAGELLNSLGYQLKFGANARKMRLTEKIVSGIYEIYRKNIINKSRHKKRISRGIAAPAKNIK